LRAERLAVECKGDTGVGEALASTSKHITATLTYSGCKTALGECKSGTTKEQIVTDELYGWLFYIKNTAPIEVGLWLAANNKGATFAEFECSGAKFVVHSIKEIKEAVSPLVGSCLAGRAEPVNKEQGEVKLIFNELSGVQEIRKFEYEGFNLNCELEVTPGVGRCPLHRQRRLHGLARK
jgi:hypothetical protein